jgi:hypothetical protein
VIASNNTRIYRAGVDYLQRVQILLPDPQMVDVMDNLRDRVSICNWIGTQIEDVNQLLHAHLHTCHDCFDPGARRSIQILAVPFGSSVRLDGFCNIATAPTTILVDVGRVAPADWLALVAHEYAHAHLGYAGHDREYAKVLNHLCLGLGFPQPSLIPDDRSLYYWPPYSPTIDPLAWWRGEQR